MGVLVQVTATVFLCLSCINMGICIAWPSSVLLLFKSENTTLDRPMSDMDVTLLSSFPYIGALIAQPLMTMGILDKLGLKRTSMLASLLFVIAWSIIAVTNQVKIILLGVVIQGCGYGIFILVLMYIGEIAQDSIRGTLTSCPNLFVSFGLLMSYLLGGVLEYHMMVYTCLSLAVIGVVLIAILRESPVRLMLKGRDEEAAEALAFYRQTNITSIEVLTELKNIRRSLNIELEDALPLTQVAYQVHAKAGTPKKSCWQLFKTTSSIRRQFYLAMVLHTAFIYQGLPSMQVYAEPIFRATVGDDISPNLCSVIFGVIMIVAGVIAAYLTDKIGRRDNFNAYENEDSLCGNIFNSIACDYINMQRSDGFPKVTSHIFTSAYFKWTFRVLFGQIEFGVTFAMRGMCTNMPRFANKPPTTIAQFNPDPGLRLLIWADLELPLWREYPLQIHSSIVCGVCCLFLGTQVVTKWFPHWTMLVSIYVFATSHTLGSGTVPFVVSAEIFLPEVKDKLMILLIEWSYFCSFSCMLLFSILIQAFGLAFIFYFFSLVCFITGIYFYYYLPETKGLPVYAIQAIFTKEVHS